MKPIRPEEVPSRKREIIPSEVFEAFNEMICLHYRQDEAVFKRVEVVQLIADKLAIHSREVKQSWLDIEDSYNDAGWIVKLEIPDITERFPAVYTFRKKLRD